MSRPCFPTIVRLLVGLLLVACLAPLAAAQVPNDPHQPSLNAYLEDPGHALVPGANESVLMKVTYTPGQASVPAVSQDTNDPTNSNAAPTRITFAPKETPPWVRNVSFQPADINVSWTPGSHPNPVPVLVILQIAPDAPAGNHQNVTIALHADANGPTPAADAVTGELMLRPGNVPQVKVAPQSAGQALLKGGSPQAITFLVTNVGNGPITARLNVTARPQDSIVDVPATITLEAGQTLPVDVTLQLPWTYGESGTLTLEATPLSADDLQGKAAHADVDIAGESAVPGVGPLGVLALLGLLALARRR